MSRSLRAANCGGPGGRKVLRHQVPWLVEDEFPHLFLRTIPVVRPSGGVACLPIHPAPARGSWRTIRWLGSIGATRTSRPAQGANLPLATRINAATTEIFHVLAAVIHDRVHSHPHYGIALAQNRHSFMTRTPVAPHARCPAAGSKPSCVEIQCVLYGGTMKIATQPRGPQGRWLRPAPLISGLACPGQRQS